jgi:hypothetical protein
MSDYNDVLNNERLQLILSTQEYLIDEYDKCGYERNLEELKKQIENNKKSKHLKLDPTNPEYIPSHLHDYFYLISTNPPLEKSKLDEKLRAIQHRCRKNLFDTIEDFITTHELEVNELFGEKAPFPSELKKKKKYEKIGKKYLAYIAEKPAKKEAAELKLKQKQEAPKAIGGSKKNKTLNNKKKKRKNRRTKKR